MPSLRNLVNIREPMSGRPSAGWYRPAPPQRVQPRGTNEPWQPGPYFIEAVTIWDGQGYLRASNDLQIDSLAVSGDIDAGGNITAGGDITAGGCLIGTCLEVNGPSTLNGTLSVSGDATFGADVDVADNITAGNNITADGCLIGNCLEVNGPSTLNGNVAVTGTLSVDGPINATGDISTDGCLIGNCLEITGPSTFNGSVQVNGNQTVTGAINAGSVTAVGDITAGGCLIGNCLEITGPSTLNGDLNVSGTVTAGTINAGSGTITNLDVPGTLTANIGNFTSVTASGNITAGGCLIGNCLEITGPSTLNGDLNVSGTVTANVVNANGGTITNLSVPGTLTANIGNFQSVTAAGNITAGGCLIGNCLEITGPATINGNLNVSGTVTAGAGDFGNLNATNATIDNLTVTGSVSLPGGGGVGAPQILPIRIATPPNNGTDNATASDGIIVIEFYPGPGPNVPGPAPSYTFTCNLPANAPTGLVLYYKLGLMNYVNQNGNGGSPALTVNFWPQNVGAGGSIDEVSTTVPNDSGGGSIPVIMILPFVFQGGGNGQIVSFTNIGGDNWIVGPSGLITPTASTVFGVTEC